MTGCQPSRKIKAFIIMALAVIGCMLASTFAHTPADIATHALYIIGAGGLFTVGGQALVDSLGKIKQKEQ